MNAIDVATDFGEVADVESASRQQSFLSGAYSVKYGNGYGGNELSITTSPIDRSNLIGISPVQLAVTVFWGDACEEFVEGVFGFFLGFEDEGSVANLEGDFAVGGHGDGVGVDLWSVGNHRAGNGEREIAGVVGCELDAIPILGGIVNGEGLEHGIHYCFG
jgi:hypothetical protein